MSESIGAALKAAREARRLTLAQVSETTKVRSHYLQALESDDMSAMPSAAQARGFLRIYSQFLGLDLEKLIPPPGQPAPEETPAARVPDTPAGQDESKSGRPNLLTRLRKRFSIRGGAEGDADSTTAPASAPTVDDAVPSADPRAVKQPEAESTDKKKARS